MQKHFKKGFKKLFIPCTDNNFKPSFLETRGAFIFGLTILALFLLSINIPNLIKGVDYNSQMSAVLPGVLIELTNEERAKSSIHTLQENELLNQAALLKAEDMASKSYFAHTSPDGKRPWNWLQDVGYKYQYAGENLAVNFSESKDVTIAWMNSPTHKANIVKPVYKEIGIGVATGTFNGVESIFVAQVFASPFVLGGGPANVSEAVSPFTNPIRNFFNYLIYHNHDLTNIILIGFLILVVLALVLKIIIHVKIQHPKLITNALILIAFIILLLLINKFIIHQKQSDIQFSSYEYNVDQNGQINAEN